MLDEQLSERALARRIDRKLNLEGQRLRKYDERWRNSWQYGPYYIVTHDNLSVEYGISDLEGLGKELGVI
jgi:hypothetical protein